MHCDDYTSSHPTHVSAGLELGPGLSETGLPANDASVSAEEAKTALCFSTARRILEIRRARLDFFDRGLFAEPSWDVLLMLYINEVGGRETTKVHLAKGTEVPASTTLRWLSCLAERGLVTMTVRDEVSLTTAGRGALTTYLTKVSGAGTCA